MLRLLIGFTLFIALATLGHFVWPKQRWPSAVVAAIVLVVMRWIEGRSMIGPRPLVHTLQGFSVGAVFQTAVVLVIVLFGGYVITGVHFDAASIATGLLFGAATGLSEELLFRGLAFRLIEESRGSVWALVLTAVFFGAAHFGAPGATWFTSLAIALEAGLLLGAAYMLTRSLFFVAALHCAWNFFQSAVYGFHTSGHDLGSGIIEAAVSGPEWLTGGAFGPEASVQAVVIGVALSVGMLIVARRKTRRSLGSS